MNIIVANDSTGGDTHFWNTEVSCTTWTKKEDYNLIYSIGIFAEDPSSFSFPLLLIQIILIMSTSRAINFLLRRLHQLCIVGDIITGVVLGPEILGRILPNTRNSIFPDRELKINQTIAAFGIMLYAFIVSVKMDPMILFRSGRKPLIIALSNTIIPILFISLFSIPLRSFFPSPTNYFLIFLLSLSSIANFSVIADSLSELNLLNSELGRLALSSSMLNSALGWSITLIFIALKQSQGSFLHGIKWLFSFTLIISFILFFFKRWVLWIVRNTPKGKRVGEFQVYGVLVCVLGIGFVGEVFGTTSITGMVALGLVTPEGPPLGAALVEKVELLSNEIMLPLFFSNVGGHFKPGILRDWRVWIVLIFVSGFVSVIKFVCTYLPAVYFFQIVPRKAIILGVIFNFKGLVHLLHYHRLRIHSLIDDDTFSIMLFSMFIASTITAPVVQKLYKPLAETHLTKHPRIQHLKPSSQLRLLACVQNEDPIPSILNLLEASSSNFPLYACILHLEEQLGRLDSTLIAHKDCKGFINATNMDRLHNAFISYEKSKNGLVEIQPYTSVSPFHNISQEICALAAQENVAFVVIPVYRKSKIGTGLAEDHALRSEIPQILAQAPCSVGLLIHNGLEEEVFNSPFNFQHHIGVIFWSGPDYRESLAYASRMARHAGIRLTVTRFLLSSDSDEIEDKTQVSLDEEYMAVFQLENAGNERIVIQEIVVQDMEHAISVIRSVGCAGYDLVLVGQRVGWSSQVLNGLEEWCENPELGVVGDVMASLELDRCCSVLIVQQRT